MVLLSGIGINSTAFNEYFRKMTNNTDENGKKLTNFQLNDIDITLGCAACIHRHRIFDASLSAINFRLHHIYTGHRNVVYTREGQSINI